MSLDAGFARLAGRGLIAVGALAAGAAIGALAERSLLRRAALATSGDDEGFGMLRGTVHVVEATDGSLLHAEVDDPEVPDPTGLTVIFCHGYALNQDSWHFQRQALRGRARLVFYDQRSHGRSDRAEFDSHHVDQLGTDLGSVIDALAPHGPLVLVGHSMGGVSSLDEVTKRPLLTLDSGPAGGVLGTRYFGTAYNEQNIIAVDMGGTSFDVSLIHNGEISLDERPVIAQYTFLTPKIATYSIGAGGGSIVWIDPYGIPQVGPQSAGSSPGSVCYDMGGTEPTTTDVDLILGYLNPDYSLWGRKKLNKNLAEAALAKVANGLGLDLTRTAAGAFKIVNSHMADLVRKVTIERGYDPRNFVLFAFGGAGPTHCPFLARELGIKTVYIPNHSSVFSALGMLTGGIVHSYQKSYHTRFPLSVEAAKNIKQIYDQLESQLYDQFSREGIEREKVTFSRYAYIKYRLQATQLPVLLGGSEVNAENQQDIIKAFEKKYASVYGENTGYPEAGIEILKYRVDAFYSTPVPHIARSTRKASSSSAKALKGKRNAYFDPPGRYLEVSVYDSSKLRFGNMIKGPAIVERMGDTVVIPADTTAHVDAFQNIKIEL